ncbi:S-methyl-5'-thioadenosine phosphorylase [bacterium]|nr:S-methyl-5'-thioadenosine phosphorylase [bacterium]
MQDHRVGVIGGSGLYELEGFEVRERRSVTTPFGQPSDELVLGTLEGREIIFLPRHGRGHRYSPTEVPYRANLFAMKALGVGRLISVSAVGSMKEDIQPGHLVLPDQFIDRTVARPRTFFEHGIVAHVPLADPVCADLRGVLRDSADREGVTRHDGGTYVCIEGPQFSTRAESKVFRSWGVSVIGMTNLPEARLAREAEICYSTLALSTDYDCWHETEEDVSVERVIAVLMKNVDNAKRIIRRAILALDVKTPRTCACSHALKNAIMTRSDAVPMVTKRALAPLIGRYISVEDPEES